MAKGVFFMFFNFSKFYTVLYDQKLNVVQMFYLIGIFWSPELLIFPIYFTHSFNHFPAECLSVLVSSLKSIEPRTLDELKLTPTLPCTRFQQVLPSLHSVIKNVIIVDYLHHGTLFADYVGQMWSEESGNSFINI